MTTLKPDDRLIVTNGDCAVGALDTAGIAGDLLPWRDVLHDGPVPASVDAGALARIRARFIASCGWAEEAAVFHDIRGRDDRLEAARSATEIVLWLEHDLYDQLQLLQVLDRLAQRPVAARLSLVCRRAFVAEQNAETLVRDFAAREPIGADQIALARRAWAAFRAPTPTALVAELAAIQAVDAPLPFLAAALERLLAEYPSVRDGLSRTERRTLEAVRAGSARVRALFDAVGATEEARFMGDASFWRIVGTLTNGASPALATVEGATFHAPHRAASPAAFRAQRVRLTDFGDALLAQRGDWIASNGIDRWLGGVHLHATAVWRWDQDARRLVAPS